MSEVKHSKSPKGHSRPPAHGHIRNKSTKPPVLTPPRPRKHHIAPVDPPSDKTIVQDNLTIPQDHWSIRDTPAPAPPSVPSIDELPDTDLESIPKSAVVIPTKTTTDDETSEDSSKRLASETPTEFDSKQLAKTPTKSWVVSVSVLAVAVIAIAAYVTC